MASLSHCGLERCLRWVNNKAHCIHTFSIYRCKVRMFICRPCNIHIGLECCFTFSICLACCVRICNHIHRTISDISGYPNCQHILCFNPNVSSKPLWLKIQYPTVICSTQNPASLVEHRSSSYRVHVMDIYDTMLYGGCKFSLAYIQQTTATSAQPTILCMCTQRQRAIFAQSRAPQVKVE